MVLNGFKTHLHCNNTCTIFIKKCFNPFVTLYKWFCNTVKKCIFSEDDFSLYLTPTQTDEAIENLTSLPSDEDESHLHLHLTPTQESAPNPEDTNTAPNVLEENHSDSEDDDGPFLCKKLLKSWTHELTLSVECCFASYILHYSVCW